MAKRKKSRKSSRHKASAPPFVLLLAERTLRVGMKGEDVRALQLRLDTLGFLATSADGVFGPITEAAVKEFQKARGIRADGVCGPSTFTALAHDPSQPVEDVVTTPRSPAQYAAKYRAAKILPSKLQTVTNRARLLSQFRESQYEPVAKIIGCPWYVVAAIHNEEEGSDVGKFRCCLHNGEQIIGNGKKTRLAPAGRGPFATWTEAAIDALKYDGAHRRTSWDLGSTLQFLEAYNGFGFRNKGVATPYLWSFTDQYSKGFYGERVVNGRPVSTWYPDKISDNYGAVAILKALGIEGA